VSAAFDTLLFSCELGETKPSRKAFEAALTRLGAAPDRVFFVDDSSRNVDTARAMGLRAVVYTGPVDLAATLRAAGVPV
jgi:putative hydrolase of the HAD superfamily